MAKLISLIFIIFLFLQVSTARSEKIYLSALPLQPKETLIGNYYPLIQYLRNKTGLNLDFYYEKDYHSVLETFKKGKIHFIALGPLPYYIVKRDFPQAKAIVYFREADGSERYSCVLVTAPDGPKRVKDIKGPVAVTQKYSTCGYFSANILLSKHGKDIKKLGYVFFDTHNDVIEAVLKGRFEAGTLKKDIAEKYRGFAIRILDETPKWPAFSLVVNPQIVSETIIQKVKEALINIPPDEAKKLIVGKYGFSEVSEKDYKIIQSYEKFIPSL